MRKLILLSVSSFTGHLSRRHRAHQVEKWFFPEIDAKSTEPVEINNEGDAVMQIGSGKNIYEIWAVIL